MRRAVLIAGLAVLAVIWIGPLLDVYRASFTAHMLAHMSVVAIAAPLIAIGSQGFESLHVRQTDAPFLISLPVIASLIELIVVWGWHAPAARAWVEASNAATVLEQASFLGAGLLLWFACLRPGSEATGAFGLLLTSVHMTLLGALLSLSSRALYRTGEVTCLGATLTAEQDQQFGGVVMLLVGAAVYLAGGVALLARMLNVPTEARAR